jgi:DNA-binding MarR family transcriptional regulator
MQTLTKTRAAVLFAIYRLERQEPPRRVVAYFPRGSFNSLQIADSVGLDGGVVTKALRFLARQGYTKSRNRFRGAPTVEHWRITDSGRQLMQTEQVEDLIFDDMLADLGTRLGV